MKMLSKMPGGQMCKSSVVCVCMGETKYVITQLALYINTRLGKDKSSSIRKI